MKKEKPFIYNNFKMYNNLYNLNCKIYFEYIIFIFIQYLINLLSPTIYPSSTVSYLIFF